MGNMGYAVVGMQEKAPYVSMNGLVDFIKETRFNINQTDYDYLVVNIIGKGNKDHLITSDNQSISWLKIYELFSFAKQFFVPTVFCIDVLNENGDKQFESMDADYDNVNVFGYSSTEIDYFGFITNALYQRRNAVFLTDIINHIMIWNKYIFTVPKDIDWDDDDEEMEYKQRERDDERIDAELPSMFDQKVKNVTATEQGGSDWSITYSIDRKSWGPFLCKYDFSAFVHDQNNNRKDIKSMKLQIERPIGTKKEIEFKKVLQNGSFINQTIREEGGNAVGNTALSVTVTTSSNQTINTPKISI